jgi:hypothetical protein
VETVLECRMCDRSVVAGRRCDVDELEVLRLGLEERLQIAVDACLRQHLTSLLAACRTDVGNRDDFKHLGCSEVRGNVPLLGNESESDECTL